MEYRGCKQFKLSFNFFSQRDSEMPASDPYNIGHDIIGAAIAASMAKRSRDRVNVHNREETKDVAKQS